jgi:hypothetical protein
MRLASIGWLAALAFLPLLAIPPAPAAAADSYLTTPGDAARALETLLDDVGRRPAVYSVRITPQEIALEVQGAGRPTDIDAWSIRRIRRLGLTFEPTRGPQPVSPPGFIRDVVPGFFPLSPADLERVPTLVAAAIERAALQDPATVSSITIARQVSILPSPSFGPVRWTIMVGTGRESASVFADEAGRIVGADLSGTERARTLNLIATESWPKDEAIADLTAVLGPDRRIRSLTVHDQFLSIDADHPTAAQQTMGYTWDLSGVRTMGIGSPLFPGTPDEASFVVGEVDLGGLSAVRDAARKAWGNDGARLVYMMLRRDMDAAGAPPLRWTLNFNDPGGESGSVVLGTDGSIVAVTLPPSRRPKLDWMAPEMVAATLVRLETELGAATRISQLMFQNDQAQVLAEDPRSPGTNANFIMDAEDMTRFGTPMPWEAETKGDYAFVIRDLAFFDAATLRRLKEETYKRLKTTPAKMPVSRYTFSVGQLMTPMGDFMVPSPDGKVTLEIRVEAANGMDGGWVTYTAAGKAFDVMMP